jgi:Holliday junction resolvase RusA-like endonuclease
MVRVMQEIALFQQIYSPIKRPISCQLVFGFKNYYNKPTKKNQDKLKRNQTIPDISNLYQFIEDCLQKAGVIINDNIIENHDGSKRIYSPINTVKITLFKCHEVESIYD